MTAMVRPFIVSFLLLCGIGLAVEIGRGHLDPWFCLKWAAVAAAISVVMALRDRWNA